MSDEQKIIPDQDGNENTKVVPVSESIKYRKRAQNAEKQLSKLEKTIDEIDGENKRLHNMLENIEKENKLSKALNQAGAIDIETALVLAKQRLEKSPKKELFEVIEEIKKEKKFLFKLDEQEHLLAAKTNRPVKCKVSSGGEYLKRQAKQASQTGSRKDIMDYLLAKRKIRN